MIVKKEQKYLIQSFEVILIIKVITTKKEQLNLIKTE